MTTFMGIKPVINTYRYPESDYDRPWGYWETTAVGTLSQEKGGLAYCDKKIGIAPGHKLSIQKHAFREEYWVIAEGRVIVHVGENANMMHAQPLAAGEKIHIPCGYWHYIENVGDQKAVFFERQIGVLLDEKDIVRLNDPRGYDHEAIARNEKLVQESGLGQNWPPSPAAAIYPTQAPRYCFPHSEQPE